MRVGTYITALEDRTRRSNITCANMLNIWKSIYRAKQLRSAQFKKRKSLRYVNVRRKGKTFFAQEGGLLWTEQTNWLQFSRTQRCLGSDSIPDKKHTEHSYSCLHKLFHYWTYQENINWYSLEHFHSVTKRNIGKILDNQAILMTDRT